MGWNLMNQVGIEIDLILGKVFLNNFHVLHPLTRILIHSSQSSGGSCINRDSTRARCSRCCDQETLSEDFLFPIAVTLIHIFNGRQVPSQLLRARPGGLHTSLNMKFHESRCLRILALWLANGHGDSKLKQCTF